MGEQLDNMIGGNPNPTGGQVYGGAPGVGGGFGGNLGRRRSSSEKRQFNSGRRDS